MVKFFIYLAGVRCLIALLKSDVEHVLVNVVNCIRVLCESYQVIQETFAHIEDALVTLVELLGKSVYTLYTVGQSTGQFS